jgi:hypothetical protein
MIRTINHLTSKKKGTVSYNSSTSRTTWHRPILSGIKRGAKPTKMWQKPRSGKQKCFEKTHIQNQITKTQNMASHRRRYVINEDNDPPPMS